MTEAQSAGSDVEQSCRYGVVDGTTWPVHVGGIEWKLRYAPSTLTREDELVAASVLHSYAFLTDPSRTQGEAIESLKRARKAAQQSTRQADQP